MNNCDHSPFKGVVFSNILKSNLKIYMLEKAETENEFLDSKNAKNMRKSLRSAIPCTAETGVWRLFVENAIKHLDFQEIIKSSLRPAGKRRKHGASYKIKSTGHLPVDFNTEGMGLEIAVEFTHFSIMYYSLSYKQYCSLLP